MASPTLLPRRRNLYGLLWWIVPVGVGVFGMRELFILPFALIFSTLPFRRLNPYIPFLWFIPMGIYVFWKPFILHFMSNSSVTPFLFCSCLYEWIPIPKIRICCCFCCCYRSILLFSPYLFIIIVFFELELLLIIRVVVFLMLNKKILKIFWNKFPW